jgi:lactate dehydrogenase-like 2-hydroxyacid dehydrogenase
MIEITEKSSITILHIPLSAQKTAIKVSKKVLEKCKKKLCLVKT